MAGVGQRHQREGRAAQREYRAKQVSTERAQSEHRASTGRQSEDRAAQSRPGKTGKAAQHTPPSSSSTGSSTGMHRQAQARRDNRVHAVRRAQASAPRTGSNNRACTGGHKRAQVRTGTGTHGRRQPGMRRQVHRCTGAQVHRRTRACTRRRGRTGTPMGERGRVWGGEGSRIIEPNLGASYMRTSLLPPPSSRASPRVPEQAPKGRSIRY